MNNTLTITNVNGCYEIFNFKQKVFPNGIIKIKKNSFDTIKGLLKNNLHNGTSTEEQLEKYLKKRVKDRKEKIIDIAFCNNWRYFVTLTFDSNNKDLFPNGYNHDRAIELLKKWINNQHNQNKNMKYIIVSEFHKKGQIHFHGLFNNVNWSLSVAINPKNKRPIIKNGCQIYNLNNYKLGFTTISEIKDTKKVSIYLSKYITKDLISLKFKKVFWCSRNLDKPLLSYGYTTKSLNDLVDYKQITYYNKFQKINSNIEILEYLERSNVYYDK